MRSAHPFANHAPDFFTRAALRPASGEDRVRRARDRVALGFYDGRDVIEAALQKMLRRIDPQQN